MKKFLVVLIVMVAVLGLSLNSFAFNNELNMSLGGGSGDFTDSGQSGDVTMVDYSLEYKRYLKALETQDSPYYLREFLQHPSFIGVGIEGAGLEVEVDGSSLKMEMGEGALVVGGMYFTEGDSTLGFGAELELSGGDFKVTNSAATLAEEESGEYAITLMVSKYFDTIRVDGEITIGSGEDEDMLGGGTTEYDEMTFGVGVSSAIDNFFWVAASLLIGERDVDGASDKTELSSIDIEAGVFPTINSAVLLSFSVMNEETGSSEAESTMVSVEGTYYFSDSLGAGLSVYNMEQEENGGMNIEVTGASAYVSYLF